MNTARETGCSEREVTMKTTYHVFVCHDETDAVQDEYCFDNKQEAHECSRRINNREDDFWNGSPVYAKVRWTVDVEDDVE